MPIVFHDLSDCDHIFIIGCTRTIRDFFLTTPRYYYNDGHFRSRREKSPERRCHFPREESVGHVSPLRGVYNAGRGLEVAGSIRIMCQPRVPDSVT